MCLSSARKSGRRARKKRGQRTALADVADVLVRLSGNHGYDFERIRVHHDHFVADQEVLVPAPLRLDLDDGRRKRQGSNADAIPGNALADTQIDIEVVAGEPRSIAFADDGLADFGPLLGGQRYRLAAVAFTLRGSAILLGPAAVLCGAAVFLRLASVFRRAAVLLN